jgi:murein DD-endopeptidase MepM/ murein hydrolase activator NlpD
VRVIKLVLLILLVQWGQRLRAQFSLPLKHLDLTSDYGYRIHPVTGKSAFHAGVDLRAHHDTVYAVADGIIAAVGYQTLLGLYIRLDHDGIQTVYGHLSYIFITTSDTVYSGETIAISGSTGRVTGEHLHFSVLFQNKPVDPVRFLYHLLKYNNHE